MFKVVQTPSAFSDGQTRRAPSVYNSGAAGFPDIFNFAVTSAPHHATGFSLMEIIEIKFQELTGLVETKFQELSDKIEDLRKGEERKERAERDEGNTELIKAGVLNSFLSLSLIHI